MELENEIKRALAKSHADYTEIRIEREWHSEVEFQKDNLENIELATELGGIIRSLVDGGWGIAVFNKLDRLEKMVDRAYRMGKAVSKEITEKNELAQVDPVRDEVEVSMVKDVRAISLPEKKKVIEDYNRTLIEFDKRIVSSNVRYRDFFKDIIYANSEGTFIKEGRPDTTLVIQAVASQGDKNIQRSYESFGAAAGFEVAEGKGDKAREVATRAVDLLSARPAPGGQHTVILDQELGGVFIHEAFGHLCEADFLHKNESLKEVLKPGRKFGEDFLNIVDDGYLEGRRGNYRYDDEGVPRQKTYLIKDGKLRGFLHSRQTAAKMDVRPTGNGRAVSYQYEPIVRMRNTYVQNGDRTFKDLIKDIDNGIYAKGAFGGQTQLEQFTFSAGYAYEIKNGEIGDLIRDVVLTGNVFRTLENIDLVANDLQIIGSAGGCGKGGQMPLPVTVGSPHIRVQNVTIGGR